MTGAARRGLAPGLAVVAVGVVLVLVGLVLPAGIATDSQFELDDNMLIVDLAGWLYLLGVVAVAALAWAWWARGLSWIPIVVLGGLGVLLAVVYGALVAADEVWVTYDSVPLATAPGPGLWTVGAGSLAVIAGGVLLRTAPRPVARSPQAAPVAAPAGPAAPAVPPAPAAPDPFAEFRASPRSAPAAPDPLGSSAPAAPASAPPDPFGASSSATPAPVPPDPFGASAPAAPASAPSTLPDPFAAGPAASPERPPAPPVAPPAPPQAPAPLPAPGWYPDPASSAHERWWDGQAWTGALRDGPGAAPGGASGAASLWRRPENDPPAR